MTDLVVFTILIPLTEDATGALHPPKKYDDWLLKTVNHFGGATVIGLALRGLWYAPGLPRQANPVEDRSNAYKVAVEPNRIDELRDYVRATARSFRQKCIYLERSGEVEFVWQTGA